MDNKRISINRVLTKLDSYFAKNDYIGAERHLCYWLDEALDALDFHSQILLYNELIGLSRKTSQKEKALMYANTVLKLLNELDIERSVGAATTYINIATAYKAFEKSDEALPYFELAKDIYEEELDISDSRLGGLYNNMALTLVDVCRFEDAYALYDKAIEVMAHSPNGELEQAITQLNIASAKEAEFGLLDGETKIAAYVEKAWELLDIHKLSMDGYYAFVCEKCASVFGYYGYFLYEKELKERALRIYERN